MDMNLLVVSSNLKLINILTFVIDSKKCQLILALNEEEAKAQIEKIDFDFVIIDHRNKKDREVIKKI